MDDWPFMPEDQGPQKPRSKWTGVLAFLVLLALFVIGAVYAFQWLWEWLAKFI